MFLNQNGAQKSNTRENKQLKALARVGNCPIMHPSRRETAYELSSQGYVAEKVLPYIFTNEIKKRSIRDYEEQIMWIFTG